MVLDSCLLSGCSVGLFGRQCFETNVHRQTPKMTGSRVDHDIAGAGLSLQTRRAISKGREPKNLSVSFSAAPKAQAGNDGDLRAEKEKKPVQETDL